MYEVNLVISRVEIIEIKELKCFVIDKRCEHMNTQFILRVYDAS